MQSVENLMASVGEPRTPAQPQTRQQTMTSAFCRYLEEHINSLDESVVDEFQQGVMQLLFRLKREPSKRETASHHAFPPPAHRSQPGLPRRLPPGASPVPWSPSSGPPRTPGYQYDTDLPTLDGRQKSLDSRSWD